MDPVELEPPSSSIRKVIIAEHQEEFSNLPALVYPEGSILTSWKMTDEERAAIFAGAELRLWVWTLGPFPPVALRVEGVEYEGDDL